MGIYSIVTTGKAVVETFTLSDDIKKYSEKINKHLLDHFSGAKRYAAAETLFSISLADALDAAGPDKKKQIEIKHYYLDRLKSEYEMSKEELSGELANKAEVVALGLAIREVALCLDDEIENFRSSSAAIIGNTQHAAEQQIRQYEELRDRAGHLFRQIDKQIGHYQDLKSKVQQIEKRTDDLVTIKFATEALKSTQDTIVSQVTNMEQSNIRHLQDFSRFQESFLQIQGTARKVAFIFAGIIATNFFMGLMILFLLRR